jgi:SAM-dependent methyltransferase
MFRQVIDPAGFEAKFRANIDPWNYAASPFEARKRAVLLHACGPGPFGRGLELACAIGETTRVLAPHCLSLLAVDSSATAVDEARRRLGARRDVRIEQALLPAGMPRGPFDLVVVSELLYYLGRRPLADLLARVEAALAPGGRVVVLHHVRPFDDASVLPSLAQALAVRSLGRRLRLVRFARLGRFEVAAFAKRRGAGARRTLAGGRRRGPA